VIVASPRLTDLIVELAKVQLEVVYLRARRAVLTRIAQRTSMTLLDDIRLAATEELAHRGLHVITYQPRSKRIV
jgi:hypothetical protein